MTKKTKYTSESFPLFLNNNSLLLSVAILYYIIISLYKKQLYIYFQLVYISILHEL